MYFLNKKVYVANAHARVQTLVSVVKMARVLEECNTEEQRFVVHFLWSKDLKCKVYS
jgi:hypothetical protein